MMSDPPWTMAGADRAIHLGAHVHIPGQVWTFDYGEEIEIKHIGRLEPVNMLPLTTNKQLCT